MIQHSCGSLAGLAGHHCFAALTSFLFLAKLSFILSYLADLSRRDERSLVLSSNPCLAVWCCFPPKWCDTLVFQADDSCKGVEIFTWEVFSTSLVGLFASSHWNGGQTDYHVRGWGSVAALGCVGWSQELAWTLVCSEGPTCFIPIFFLEIQPSFSLSLNHIERQCYLMKIPDRVIHPVLVLQQHLKGWWERNFAAPGTYLCSCPHGRQFMCFWACWKHRQFGCWKSCVGYPRTVTQG